MTFGAQKAHFSQPGGAFTKKVVLTIVLSLLTSSASIIADEGPGPDELTEQARQKMWVIDQVVASVAGMGKAELLSTLDVPLPEKLRMTYVDFYAAKGDAREFFMTPGSMGYIWEKFLEKGGPFADLSTEDWKDGLRRIYAFWSLLDNDSQKAFSWLVAQKDEARPTALQAAYIGVFVRHSRSEAREHGRWVWYDSREAWVQMLKGKNPTCHALALQYADYFATSQEMAEACELATDTEWPYLHLVAFEKTEKLLAGKAVGFLQRYLEANKADVLGNRASDMRKKAEGYLVKAKARDAATAPTGSE